MVNHGHATQAPLWSNNTGSRIAITYQEQPPPRDHLAHRCRPPARDIGLQTSWSADATASFNGSMSWSDALKQTSYRAELERKTVHGAANEDHLLARLQREHGFTQTELQATRRCIEEAASLRLEPHGSAQAEASLRGRVAGRSVSCGVRLPSVSRSICRRPSALLSRPAGDEPAEEYTACTLSIACKASGAEMCVDIAHRSPEAFTVKSNFKQDTTFILDSHSEGGSAAEASSGSTVMVITARRGAKPANAEGDSHEEAARSSAPAPSASRHSSADLALRKQLTASQTTVPSWCRPQARGTLLPAGLLDAELGALSAADSSRTRNDGRHKKQCKGQSEAPNEQLRQSTNLWQPENPLKHLSMRAALPLGAGARGGWRLGLSQRINQHLSMDAKLRGGSSKVNGSGGKITIVDLSADQSVHSMCSARDAAVRHRTFGRPSGGQIRMELQQPAGWKCSLTLNSNAQGPAMECRWLGNQAARPSGVSSGTPRPAEPDAEQIAAERGRQWHSWHLSRLELPAWQRPVEQSLPSVEARAIMKGLSTRFSSLQASMFMPL